MSSALNTNLHCVQNVEQLTVKPDGTYCNRYVLND